MYIVEQKKTLRSGKSTINATRKYAMELIAKSGETGIFSMVSIYRKDNTYLGYVIGGDGGYRWCESEKYGGKGFDINPDGSLVGVKKNRQMKKASDITSKYKYGVDSNRGWWDVYPTFNETLKKTMEVLFRRAERNYYESIIIEKFDKCKKTSMYHSNGVHRTELIPIKPVRIGCLTKSYSEKYFLWDDWKTNTYKLISADGKTVKTITKEQANMYGRRR